MHGHKQYNMKKNTLYNLLIIGCGILVVVLQITVSSRFSNFEGTDDQSVDIIGEIAPDYQPWAHSILELKSEWSEKVLFALQATLGLTIIILYIIKQRSNIKKEHVSSGCGCE